MIQAASSSVAHRQALIACYAERAAQLPGLNLYAIVDAGQHPHIPATLDTLPVLGRANLFEGMPEASLQALTPWLLHVDAAETAASGSGCHLCELAQTWPCVSWVLSALPITEIAAHLRHWFNGIVMETDGSELGAVLVRYYDARALPGFFSMLSPSQHAEFMQPIAAYGLWTRFNTWKQWLPSETGLVFPAERHEYTLAQHATYASMTRTDKLHAMLDEHYGADPAASEMAGALADRYFALAQDERYRRLHRLRGRAESLGLIDESDLFMFASLGLGIHPNFDEQPLFSEAISQAVLHKHRLSDALAELPDTAWQALDTLAIAESD